MVGSPIVRTVLWPNASLLGIPYASHRSRRRGQPHPLRPGGGRDLGRGPRGGAATPGDAPAPRPGRGRPARAASQVAPLLFYLPGCLFFAECIAKRRRQKGSGAPLSAAGARSPRAGPARGESRARPPSPAGAGPVAAPPRAAPRLRSARCRPSPRRPRPPRTSALRRPLPPRVRSSVSRSAWAHASGDAPPPPRPPATAPAAAPGPARVPAPSSPGRRTGAAGARGEGGGLGERHRPRARPPTPPPGGRAVGRGARGCLTCR